MKRPKEWQASTWIWLGLILLSLTALWWLLLSLATAVRPESTTSIIIFGFLVSAIPFGAGVYSFWRGRRAEKERAAQRRLYKKEQNSRAQSEDKTRDGICDGLRAIGLEARLAKRGRAEEKTGHGSLGLIDISEGQISWVNVRKVNTPYGLVSYHIDFGIPDRRLRPDSPEVRVLSYHTKTFPIWGQVTDLYWKGEDFGYGIIARLNNDTSIRKDILPAAHMKITAHGRYSCWIISPDKFDIPPPELWKCYQRIAQHLLK